MPYRLLRPTLLAMVFMPGVVAAQSLPAGSPSSPQPAALSADALTACAQAVLRMRTESPRLLAQNAALAERREALDARRAARVAAAAQDRPDDLEAGLARRQALQQLNAEALAVNRDVDVFREAVRALGTVRATFDRDCARRPYRRRDLEALPLPLQEAMRAGLEGIRVPELPAHLSPLPGIDGPP